MKYDVNSKAPQMTLEKAWKKLGNLPIDKLLSRDNSPLSHEPATHT